MAILLATLGAFHAPLLSPDGAGGALSSPAAVERVGQLKVIDDTATATQVADTLNEHRAALLAVGNDLVKVRELADRTVPQMQELLKTQRNLRTEWVPEGDANLLAARYLMPDGSVRLGKEEITIPMPDGTEEKSVRHGFLTEPHTLTREHEAARKAFDSYAIASDLAKRTGHRPMSVPVVRKAFIAFQRATGNIPGPVGDFFRNMWNDRGMLARVIANTSGIGGQLIAVPTIADIRRPFDLQRRLVSLLDQRMAPTRSFKPPIVTGRAIARKRGATQDAAARYPVQTFTTSEVTVSVVDRVINVLIDDNWMTEGGLVLTDPMGFVMDWIESGDADTIEAAILHGDNAGTHQDTLATWTLGGYYTAGDLADSNSMLKQWIGLRARAFDDSNTVAGGGTFTAATHYGALAAMGNLGADAVMVSGLYCFYVELLANTIFTTTDKMGALATQITGELGKIGKTPVVISEFLDNEYASSGLYTGSGTTDTIVYFNPRAWAYYEYDGGAGQWDQAYPDQGSRYVGFKRSSVLTPTCLSTERPAAAIINL